MRLYSLHILRTQIALLLSSLAVVANAVCPSMTAVLDSQDEWELMSESGIESIQNKTEIEVVEECQIVEGTYEIEGVNPKTAPSVAVSEQLNEKFSAKSLIVPGAFIAAGVVGLETSLFKGKGDKDKEPGDKDATNFEDIVQYVPAAAYLSLGLIPGIEHKHSFVERSMATVTAYGMMFLITKPVKHWVHEQRPDLTSDDSFPSGHAATVFTGAELMRLEYGTGIGIGAYAVATTVSALRIYHNRHWFNDVIAGAGIGILCARASYWLLPFERKLFGIKDPKVGVAAFPICDPQRRQLALGCCINF